MSGSRVDTDQADVLQAIVDLLIGVGYLNLTDQTCFMTIYPELPNQPTGNYYVTVSPTDGTFPEQFQIGGGVNQCTEETGVLVTIWSQLKLDRNGRDVRMLTDDTRGLLRLKKKVLRALVTADPQVNTPGQGGTNSVLRNLMLARRCAVPEHDPKNGYGCIALLFEVVFDWDLTS